MTRYATRSARRPPWAGKDLLTASAQCRARIASANAQHAHALLARRSRHSNFESRRATEIAACAPSEAPAQARRSRHSFRHKSLNDSPRHQTRRNEKPRHTKSRHHRRVDSVGDNHVHVPLQQRGLPNSSCTFRGERNAASGERAPKARVS